MGVLGIIFGIPLLLTVVSLASRRLRMLGIAAGVGYTAALVLSGALLAEVFSAGHIRAWHSFIFVDSLSAFFIFVTSIVSCAGAWYSLAYVAHDVHRARMTVRKAQIYYILYNLFTFSMFAVPVVNNVGFLWVAIEITTLISAFLVGFYNTKESVEAAWKYIIICSVGIILALLGTILFSYAFSLAGTTRSLNWTNMLAFGPAVHTNALKIGFIFIVIGYGTKAGLAPMHTWLPDAHSQAVSPVSALLSGVLLKMALYAIVRFGIIVAHAVGFHYFGRLMIALGVVSLIIAAGFVIVQKDVKRLLAYSSIEHMGIIAIGFGLGTPLAIAGALLHILNHAATKSLMFLSAADMVCIYKTHHMNAIRGVLKIMPFVGTMALIGLFALIGMPPFSIFVSELAIIIAAFGSGAYVIAAVILAALAVVFGAFLFHYSEMIFGKPPAGMVPVGQPLGGKAAFMVLLVPICVTAFAVPFFYKELLWIAEQLF